MARAATAPDHQADVARWARRRLEDCRRGEDDPGRCARRLRALAARSAEPGEAKWVRTLDAAALEGLAADFDALAGAGAARRTPRAEAPADDAPPPAPTKRKAPKRAKGGDSDA